MKLKIRHETSYQFDRPIPYALQRLRLIPRDGTAQKIVNWTMEIEGGVREADYDDAQDNHVTLLRIEEGASAIRIACFGEVDTDPDYHGITGPHRGYVPLWLYRQPTALTRPGSEIMAIVNRIKTGGHEGDVPLLHALSAEILAHVEYGTGATDVRTTAEEAARARRGVCQDHTHIFLAAARALGFPARYISGYLFMNEQPEQEAGHAWAEAHVNGLGWVGFDVSNGISPDDRYVRLATGRDYADAAPVHAMSFGASNHGMLVSLHVDQ